MRRRRLCLAAPALMLSLHSHAAVREVHGAHDAYAERGFALAWGVLRGSDEASTSVQIRIEADPALHARIEVIGRDPFGPTTRTWLAAAAVGATALQLSVPRPAFADHPRTEFRLTPPGADGPALVVYYLGVPDTTPEFNAAAALAADLAARIERARRSR